LIFQLLVSSLCAENRLVQVLLCNSTRDAAPKRSEAEEPVVLSTPQLLLFASDLFGAASRVLLQSKTCTNRFSAHRDETSS